jgi:hypothetical protein
MRRLAMLLSALLLAAGAACSGDDGPSRGAGPCPAGNLDAAALLRCVGPAIARVATPIATGSGVLVDGGYLVTSAHLVDPYAAVDLTFPDRSRRTDVPVLGIDAFADIAVLGPIPDVAAIDARPLALHAGSAVEQGDDVFLLGYPGELEDEPEPTISRGILSRTRSVHEYDQTYLQTDASIGGGQSGGALVDGRGRVVGISGLSYADEFALALDGDDVQAAVDAVRAGRGDAYAPIPDLREATTRHALDLPHPLARESLVVGAADEDRTIEVAVGDGRPDVGLVAYDLLGNALLLDQAGADVLSAVSDLSPSDLGIEVSAPEPGGRYRFDLPAGSLAVVQVSTSNPAGAHVEVDTSVPSAVAPRTDPQPLQLGATASGTFDFFELNDLYSVDLAAGERVRVTATTPQGDAAVLVEAPGTGFDRLEVIDDGGGGLYDYDAEGTYTAPVDGTYWFGVLTYDAVVTGYRFTVERA